MRGVFADIPHAHYQHFQKCRPVFLQNSGFFPFLQHQLRHRQVIQRLEGTAGRKTTGNGPGPLAVNVSRPADDANSPAPRKNGVMEIQVFTGNALGEPDAMLFHNGTPDHHTSRSMMYFPNGLRRAGNPPLFRRGHILRQEPVFPVGVGLVIIPEPAYQLVGIQRLRTGIHLLQQIRLQPIVGIHQKQIFSHSMVHRQIPGTG